MKMDVVELVPLRHAALELAVLEGVAMLEGEHLAGAVPVVDSKRRGVGVGGGVKSATKSADGLGELGSKGASSGIPRDCGRLELLGEVVDVGGHGRAAGRPVPGDGAQGYHPSFTWCGWSRPPGAGRTHSP